MNAAKKRQLLATYPELEVFIEEIDKLDNRNGLAAKTFAVVQMAEIDNPERLKLPESRVKFLEVGGNGTTYCVFLRAQAIWQKHLETGGKQVALQQLFLEELGARRASDYDDAGKKSLLFHRGQMLANEILVKWLGSYL